MKVELLVSFQNFPSKETSSSTFKVHFQLPNSQPKWNLLYVKRNGLKGGRRSGRAVCAQPSAFPRAAAPWAVGLNRPGSRKRWAASQCVVTRQPYRAPKTTQVLQSTLQGDRFWGQVQNPPLAAFCKDIISGPGPLFYLISIQVVRLYFLLADY